MTGATVTRPRIKAFVLELFADVDHCLVVGDSHLLAARLRTFDDGGELLHTELLNYTDPPDLRGPVVKARSALKDRARPLRTALGLGPRGRVDHP